MLNKVAKVSGNGRTAAYEILTGTTTETLHREFGFAYHFDVSGVFFNTRLASERIADQTESGERVYVQSCGVGPFVIQAAARGAHVVAVEQNPDAFIYLEENIGLTKVKQNIIAIQGDAFDIGQLTHWLFDQIMAPAPYGLDRIFDTISPLVARNGMMHFYTFKTRNEIPALIEECAQKGFDVPRYSPWRNVAPGVSRWVFDLVHTSRP